MKTLILLLTLAVAFFTVQAQQLTTYPTPRGAVYSMHNNDYTVKVRQPGREWQDLFEYNVKVDLNKVQDASMVYFDFSGRVEVSVRLNNGDIRSVRIRPSVMPVIPVIHGQEAIFTLDKPARLSVEFNGDKLHNLHVFANAPETDKPDPKDPNVIYFAPGIHSPPDQPGDTFNIPSNKTVYIAGGAILKGRLLCNNVHNVRIIGRGIIDQPLRGIEITHSQNIEIKDIMVINPKHYTVYGGESTDINIKNLKTFSCNGWSDGIDLMSCSNVTVDDCFIRTSDDCIALYGHRWDFYGNSKNIKVLNSTLWADVAHPTVIGLHGNTATVGDTIENITFKNIDILQESEHDPEYQGCMAITAGDYNLVRNIRYEDIRVDDFNEGKLVNLRVVYNKQYNTGIGRGIKGVYFKNITYNGANNAVNMINGFDKTHTIDDVTFDHVLINNKPVLNAVSGNLWIGEFTKNIEFKK